MELKHPIEPGSIGTLGHDLARPECVLATRQGDLYVSHRGAGITHIRPDGQQQFIGAHAQIEGHEFVPNGFCMLPGGDFLIANIGEAGGVWRMTPKGELSPFLREADGIAMAVANFVMNDELGRVWITVSTRMQPRYLSYRPNVADGFIVLVDGRGARIVAEGLAFTNEVRLGDAGASLYVSETFGRRISRFAIGKDGALQSRSTFAEFGHGDFPDGIAFDAEHALWVTSIVSNRLYRVTRDGAVRKVLEDSDAAHVAWVEFDLQAGKMGREHFYTAKSEKLKNTASLAFGGPDLKTVYMGSLLDDRLISFRSAVAGVPMSHWG